MIVVKLIGGLGNQMFQYAAARSLSLRLGVPLKLDISGLQQNAAGAYTQRQFELNRFNILADIATADEIQSFVKYKNHKVLRVLQRRLPALFSRVYFAESGSHYMEAFEKLGSDTYLEGFWQSEKYFKAYRREILNEFTIKETMPLAVKTWHQHILSVNALAFHVRRGDYVSLASAAEFHGLCSTTYYQKASAEISAKEIFIFSDDLAWCKEHLKFNETTHYVSHHEHAVWDMFLMQTCKYQVIANSSFSWWAAWLNQHTNKRVFVPEHWFSQIQTQTLDILADGWEIVNE